MEPRPHWWQAGVLITGTAPSLFELATVTDEKKLMSRALVNQLSQNRFALARRCWALRVSRFFIDLLLWPMYITLLRDRLTLIGGPVTVSAISPFGRNLEGGGKLQHPSLDIHFLEALFSKNDFGYISSQDLSHCLTLPDSESKDHGYIFGVISFSIWFAIPEQTTDSRKQQDQPSKKKKKDWPNLSSLVLNAE